MLTAARVYRQIQSITSYTSLQSPSTMNSWLPSRTKHDPLVAIQIDGHFQSKVYTSGSTISGCVTLSAKSHTPFQAVQIALRGITSTAGQALQYSNPFTSHSFLYVNIPVPATTLPTTRILEAGASYRIPFTFVIPHQLRDIACQHENTAVWERHLQPPPTMGSWDLDDLAGGSVHVDYFVRARLILGKDEGGKQRHLDNIHSLKVIPPFPEQPPLDISPSNLGYCLSQSKIIRKNLVGPKLGRISASVTEPKPITLRHDKLESSDSQIPIHLEFIPCLAYQTPPDIRVKSAIIDITTNYWLGLDGYLPDQHEMSNKRSPVAPWLTSRTIVLDKPERAAWKKQQIQSAEKSQKEMSEDFDVTQEDTRTPALTRPSSSSTNQAPTEFKSATVYKASVIQSFNLPTGKFLFLPTFYSCLVSRTYKLQLVLTVGGCGSICLTVPLQIAVEGCDGVQNGELPCYTPPESSLDLNDNSLPPYYG